MSHNKRSTTSYIAEYLMKLMMIIYLASVFYFPETLNSIDGYEVEFDGLFLLRFILFIVLSVFLVFTSEKVFKIAGFSLMILSAIVKILMLISQDNFHWYTSTQLTDSMLIVSISLYYIYRHNKKIKAKEYKRKKRKKFKKIEESI